MATNFLLMFLLVAVVYVWARESVGKWWALLPAFLTAVSPHFVTENPLPALATTVALTAFFEFILHPSRFRILMAGMALGAAQLAAETAILLPFYFTGVVIFFYAVGVIRDWPITAPENRAVRFRVRGIRYLRSIIIICLLAALFLYTVSFIQAIRSGTAGTASALRAAYDRVVSFYGQYRTLIVSYPSSLSLEILVKEPLPAVIIVALAALAGLAGITQSLRRTPVIVFLSASFVPLSLLVFVILHGAIYHSLASVAPAIFFLTAAPIQRAMTMPLGREVLIVIAHELLSFSIRWIIFFGLLAWYAATAVYLYFHY